MPSGRLGRLEQRPPEALCDLCDGIVGFYVEPMDARETSKPGALALGKAPCVNFNLLKGLFLRPFAGQVVDDFSVTDGLRGLWA